MEKRMTRTVILVLWLLSACATMDPVRKDPFYESFFEKTRLIMTEHEIHIYKMLPDKKAKEEFIKEFWLMRDPDPKTIANENKMEFERRIAFANEWFSDWKTFRGRRMGRGKDAERGWRTDKGWIYIVFGHPDLVSYQAGTWEPMKLNYVNEGRYEVWHYMRFNLFIGFYRTTANRWRLTGISQLLYEMMERAKLMMVSPEYIWDMNNALQFSATHKRNFIEFKVPVSRINFEDMNGELVLRLAVKVNIYRNNQRMDTLEETFEFSFPEEKLLDMKNIDFKIPFAPNAKGEYILDIIMTDLKSPILMKCRRYVKFTYKG